MLNTEYKFDFTVIMAVYNVESYINEAVDSIINQNYSFEKVQIILSDDGSTDKSFIICDEYAKKYPQNIIALHKENGGQASARNMALPYAQGKYISFTDPDDKLEPDTLKNVYSFFEKQNSDINLVCIPLILFGSMTGPHPLNNKFLKGTRVIDVNTEYDLPLLSCSSAFIRHEAAKEICFDTSLITAEDAKEVLKIILKTGKYGVINEKNSAYLYRRYSGSTVATAQRKSGWYLPYINGFSKWALDYSKSKFTQYTVMQDLQWKIINKTIIPGVLSEAEEKEYITGIYDGLIKKIDDDILLSPKELDTEHKLYLLYKKHGTPTIVTEPELNLRFLSGTSFNIGKLTVTLCFIKINNGVLTVEGMYLHPNIGLQCPEFTVTANGSPVNTQALNYKEQVLSVNTPIACLKSFSAQIPLSKKQRLHIGFRYTLNGKTANCADIRFGQYAPVTRAYNGSHYVKEGYLLTPTLDGIKVEPTNAIKNIGYELKFDCSAVKKLGKAAIITAMFRLTAKLLKRFNKKRVWLITDRGDRADDNGEVFYRYMCAHSQETGITPVFAVGEGTKAYTELSKIGKVIPYMSKKHKLYHIIAEHTISAYSHNEISNPFMGGISLYCDLTQDNKIVFLQHGIIKDDLSLSLNKYAKNYSLFITSTQKERLSVITGNYGYSSKSVVLTGLPRYDRLYNNTQKIITIMPTWREGLFGNLNPVNSRWELLPGFENSEYYRFYHALFNNQELINICKENGYILQYMPHPAMAPYASLLPTAKEVVTLNAEANYHTIFAESALILTDYSSAVFDFAYLKKPVIYTQFDNNHYAPGYFSYKDDGFGEITRTVDETVELIKKYIKNNCEMPQIYKDRANVFFAYTDKNNCERVYNEIINYTE